PLPWRPESQSAGEAVEVLEWEFIPVQVQWSASPALIVTFAGLKRLSATEMVVVAARPLVSSQAE
ncbi:MAG: hypothetical protein ACREIC_21395, partial [Limisphaerales bacterium]